MWSAHELHRHAGDEVGRGEQRSRRGWTYEARYTSVRAVVPVCANIPSQRTRLPTRKYAFPKASARPRNTSTNTRIAFNSVSTRRWIQTRSSTLYLSRSLHLPFSFLPTLYHSAYTRTLACTREKERARARAMYHHLYIMYGSMCR